MRVFKTRIFGRFQRGERISDATLANAVRSAEAGLIDADLGGGLIKQRIARPGQGKSGGYRTVIAYRRGDRAVFLHGFAKSDQDNIGDADLADLRRLGRSYLELDQNALHAAEIDGKLMEVDHGRDDKSQARAARHGPFARRNSRGNARPARASSLSDLKHRGGWSGIPTGIASV